MNLLNSLRRFNAVTGRLAPGVSARVSRRVLMRPRAHAPKAWEADALARAERVGFRFGLSALRWGERDAPVVLMLHGWEGRPTQSFARSRSSAQSRAYCHRKTRPVR